MAAIKLLLVILCTAFIGRTKLPQFHLLKQVAKRDDLQLAQRSQLVKTAIAELGVREVGGNNKGPKIAEYLAVVNLHRPEPWCAAFISYIFKKNGYTKPCSGWSPDLFPAARRVKLALPGNLIGIYFPKLKRIAHVGMIVREKNDWVYTIEGNTKEMLATRDGDGVFYKVRHRRSIYQIANWVTERGVKQ